MSRQPAINYAANSRKRKLVLVVDVREGKNQLLFGAIKSRMEALGAVDQLEVRQLEIFDFQYVFFDDRDRTFGPHIERKTAEDAAASIKDGRWKEQMGRAHAVPNKIHIFEGNLLSKYYGIDPKALIGAVVKPVMRQEFASHLTSNMEATADMLVAWLTYLEHVEDVKVVDSFTYVSHFQAECRKRDFVEENSLSLMIKSFAHGGSAGVANVVSTEYKTLGELQAAFLAKPMATKRHIANLTYTVGTNIVRVGPAATMQIYKMCDIDRLAALLPRGQQGKEEEEKEEKGSKKRKKAPASVGRAGKKKKGEVAVVVNMDKAEEIDDDDDDDSADEAEEAELAALMDQVEQDYRKQK